jgi:hypothetical protein
LKAALDGVLGGAVVVLHVERLGEVNLEGVVDVLSGNLFEGEEGGVEVPVVVVVEGAGVLRASLGVNWSRLLSPEGR